MRSGGVSWWMLEALGILVMASCVSSFLLLGSLRKVALPSSYTVRQMTGVASEQVCIERCVREQDCFGYTVRQVEQGIDCNFTTTEINESDLIADDLAFTYYKNGDQGIVPGTGEVITHREVPALNAGTDIETATTPGTGTAIETPTDSETGTTPGTGTGIETSTDSGIGTTPGTGTGMETSTDSGTGTTPGTGTGIETSRDSGTTQGSTTAAPNSVTTTITAVEETTSQAPPVFFLSVNTRDGTYANLQHMCSPEGHPAMLKSQESVDALIQFLDGKYISSYGIWIPLFTVSGIRNWGDSTLHSTTGVTHPFNDGESYAGDCYRFKRNEFLKMRCSSLTSVNVACIK